MQSEPNTPTGTDAPRSVLSALGLKVKLAVFVTVVLVVLGAAMTAMVARIFDELSPSTRADLAWKTRRGAAELSQRLEYGILLRDDALIDGELADYMADDDVVGIVVEGMDGQQVFDHGKVTHWVALSSRPKDETHDLADALGSWSEASIEGTPIGRVGLLVSKRRISAGELLRERMIAATVLGAVAAIVLCLLFVNLYIGPILRLTADTLVKLEETTERALESARVKSQFLANMSHEIRTPMNGILGMLDLLGRTGPTPTQGRFLRTMETSAHALLGLINDVLDFSKLEAGKVVLRPADFEVRELVQDTVELLAARAHEKRLELVHVVEPSVPDMVRADADRIRQILVNLISNAIKFTERGHVHLRVAAEDAGAGSVVLAFEVRDTGVGIAAQDLRRLFQSFSQVDGSLTRAHGGTGLGLVISRQLAQAMDGDVTVESEVGVGSLFTARLAALLSAETLTPERVAESPSTPHVRVHVVSGSTPIQEQVLGLTEAWGMESRVHSRCDGALAAVEAEVDADDVSPPVVIVDVPVAGVPADAQKLSEVCAGEGVPVVFLVGNVKEGVRGITGAPQVTLRKPMRASELYNAVVGLREGDTAGMGAHASPAPADALSPSGTPVVAPDAPRVLVVDDNEINRVVARSLLEELGYRTDVAVNGEEAVQKVSTSKYAAVLMDCQMPVLDGYGATRRIRALGDERAKTPIIALTAHALTGDRDKVLDAGMDDYATKPVRPRALSRTLRRWISEPPKCGGAECDEAPAEGAAGANSVRAPVLEDGVRRPPTAVRLFVDGMVAEASRLLSLGAEGTLEDVRRQAHKMKGACLTMGASEAAALCARIEETARGGNIDGSRIGDLQVAIGRAVAAMKEIEDAGHSSADPTAGGPDNDGVVAGGKA